MQGFGAGRGRASKTVLRVRLWCCYTTAAATCTWGLPGQGISLRMPCWGQFAEGPCNQSRATIWPTSPCTQACPAPSRSTESCAAAPATAACRLHQRQGCALATSLHLTDTTWLWILLSQAHAWESCLEGLQAACQTSTPCRTGAPAQFKHWQHMLVKLTCLLNCRAG